MYLSLMILTLKVGKNVHLYPSVLKASYSCIASMKRIPELPVTFLCSSTLLLHAAQFKMIDCLLEHPVNFSCLFAHHFFFLLPICLDLEMVHTHTHTHHTHTHTHNRKSVHNGDLNVSQSPTIIRALFIHNCYLI